MPQLYPCHVEEPALLAIPAPLRRTIAWALITAFCSLYYVLPGLAFLALGLLAMGRWYAAIGITAALLLGTCAPMREWPAARRFMQIFYPIFGVRHNLSPDRVAQYVERSVEHGDRYILGSTPACARVASTTCPSNL